MDLYIHPLDRLVVILVRPRNTLNIGAVARAMSNFGCRDLRVVDIFYKDFRKAVSAVGPSALLLEEAKEFDTLAEATADCTLVVGTTGADERKPTQPLERLEEASARIHAGLAQGRVALLFGSEKFGLSKDDFSHCHSLLRIPTREEHPSMNLGQAAALCLYELARVSPAQSSAQATQSLDQPAPPTMESLDRIAGLLQQALRASEYPGMETDNRERQLRSLVRRLGVPADDTTHWTGFLRQILWKLRGNASR